jgi:hydroxyacylglutathione hydrolase
VLFNREARIAFGSDVLFNGSIDRTDPPRGDHSQLLRFITEPLWSLGEDMQHVPRPGPMSTFRRERRTNLFVGDAAIDPPHGS